MNSNFYLESWYNVYTYVLPGDENWKSTDFPLRFSVYIQGSSDARIVLSSVKKPSVTDSVYDIRIGAVNNALKWISKQIDGEPVARAYEQNLLSPLKPVKIVIEVAADGVIQLFSSFNPYVALISWKDPNPLPINYIGFASDGRVEYFYEVDENGLLNSPYRTVNVSDVKHPLLSALDFAHGLKDMRKFTSFIIFLSWSSTLKVVHWWL